MPKRIFFVSLLALLTITGVACTNVEEEVELQVDEDAPVLEEAETLVFAISGTNYAFSETELTVGEGDTVRILFTSEDGFHDWVLDEFAAATEQVQTGGVTEVTFVADKAGTYEYYCSVGEHRANGMIGTLIVE